MVPFLRLAEHKNSRSDYDRAKEMRNEPTNGEEILWYYLRDATRNKKYRFRRQHPIHPYIADFACLKLRLIVEVDGASHSTRLDRDKKCDSFLAEEGWEVMRFSNSAVIVDRDSVLTAILYRADHLERDRYVPLP